MRDLAERKDARSQNTLPAGVTARNERRIYPSHSLRKAELQRRGIRGRPLQGAGSLARSMYEYNEYEYEQQILGFFHMIR
jgi:hypothetical protein